MSWKRSKEKKLEKQIAACEIKAPSDGLVVYANDPTRAFSSNTPRSRKGRQVRERQKIFSLPDISQMQVNTKVHESQINKLKPGHEGEDPRRRVLERDAGRHGDRRGAPARLDQLLQLGHQGLHDQGQDRSAAAGAQAGHDRRGDDPGRPLRQGADGAGAGDAANSTARTTSPRRSTIASCKTEVELGLSNEKYVEIMKGVKEGDVVAMSPMSLMTDEEKRKAFGSAAKATQARLGRRKRPPTRRLRRRRAAAGAAQARSSAVAGAPGKGADRRPKARRAGKAQGKGGARQRPACDGEDSRAGGDERSLFARHRRREERNLQERPA